MRVIVTGGAGFIGLNLLKLLVRDSSNEVLNIDKLTYAANSVALQQFTGLPNYRFEQQDICNGQAMGKIFHDFQPDYIFHLAAESHVDRSIDGPAAFLETNILGTYQLLEAARGYWNEVKHLSGRRFRFHHISTDEVFGDLEADEAAFSEQTPYAPSSPYSATKAGSDHLVRAWHRTFELPVVLTNCSNNYGPYQNAEKLIPLTITNALQGKPLPVYGNGLQIRDWLYVEDHALALIAVSEKGRVGESYNIGGNNEKQNIQVVEKICALLDNKVDTSFDQGFQFRSLINYVTDRPGHDVRYAIDATKIEQDLGWRPSETFESGIEKTVDWYLSNVALDKSIRIRQSTQVV